MVAFLVVDSLQKSILDLEVTAEFFSFFFFLFSFCIRSLILCLFVILEVRKFPSVIDSLALFQEATFQGGEVKLSKYLDSFPFPYYVVLKNIEALPRTLADLLRQVTIPERAICSFFNSRFVLQSSELLWITQVLIMILVFLHAVV